MSTASLVQAQISILCLGFGHYISLTVVTVVCLEEEMAWGNGTARVYVDRLCRSPSSADQSLAPKTPRAPRGFIEAVNHKVRS